MTTSKMIPVAKFAYQYGRVPIKFMALEIIPRMKTAQIVFMTLPTPPVKSVPPIAYSLRPKLVYFKTIAPMIVETIKKTPKFGMPKISQYQSQNLKSFIHKYQLL